MKVTALAKILISLFIINSMISAKDSGPPPPPLEVSDQVWYFGIIPKDSWVSHHYFLTNPHEDTVTITGITPGCDCTHAPKPPIKIAPGETYTFKILFDTRTYFGETNRDILLETDYAPNAELELFFASEVARPIDRINIKPLSTVFISGINEQTLSIRNTSGNDLKIRMVLDNDSSLTANPMEFDLDKNSSRQVLITPAWDKFKTGSHYHCISVDIDGPPGLSRVTIPVKVNKF